MDLRLDENPDCVNQGQKWCDKLAPADVTLKHIRAFFLMTVAFRIQSTVKIVRMFPLHVNFLFASLCTAVIRFMISNRYGNLSQDGTRVVVIQWMNL